MPRGRGWVVFDLACAVCGVVGLVYGILRIGTANGAFMGILIAVMAMFVGASGLARFIIRRRTDRQQPEH